MTRRCLEGLVNEQKAKGRSLFAKIKNLSEKGVINDQLAEWAHALREVGNDAAHDTSRTVSREDAEDMLTFAEALFEHIYTFREKFEAFKARRVGTSEPRKTK